MKTICLLLPLLLCLSARAADKPDLTLTGKLDGRDNQTYKLVPFDVPAGVDRITVDFAYTGRDQKTTIDLGMLGPGGFRNNAFRGWSGGNKSRFTVSATDATPSYIVGDEAVFGAVGADPLKEKIANMRSCGKATCS